MIKFLKKHKLKFISYFLCAFAMALFTFISFSCKTYAFTIDENGNLHSNNLYNEDLISGYHSGNTGNLTRQNGVLLTNEALIYIGNNKQITISWSYNGNTNIYLDGIAYYNNDRTFKSYEQMTNQTSPKTVSTTDNEYYIAFNFRASSTITPNNINYTMINYGGTALPYEPYGVWYSVNNYNAVIQDNEDLQEQINFRDNSSLLSGIKTTLDNTNLKIYNANNLSLTQMLGTTPFHIETISFPNEDYNYNMEYCNIDTYNAIMNNNGEFINGDTLTNDPTLLYTFKTPLFISALTFSRNDTTGTRYIDLYFTDNTSTELLLSEGSENNRLDITWVNADNKYIQYISTTAEIGFNCVYAFTIPNSNQIYTSGYANGYSDGMYEQYQNDASAIQNANQSKQAMYSQGYSKGVEDASKTHDLGWSSLFFAMADTPFKVVSNVLGFELFGLNLFTTFIGMITVFGVVYLLKKFL